MYKKKNNFKLKTYWYLLAFITLIFLSVHWLWWRVLTTDEALNPMLVVFLRFFWGFLFLILFLPLFTKKWDFTKLFKWKNKIFKNKNFWFSSIFFFFTLITFNFATSFTSASNVVLIQSMAPIIVALTTLIYYPKGSSNYNFRKIFFISVIASIGSTLLVSDNSLLNQSGNNKIIWDLLAFFSMIFFAFFNFFYVELRKDFDKGNWLIITSSFLFVWLILSSPILIFYYESLFTLSQTAIYFILLISAWSTWIAYFTRFLAGRYLSAITLILIFNIVWITTMVVEYLYYWKTQNEITYKLYLWAILIISSIYYINYLSNSKK